MPLVTFVALIQLMDNFRVFEPIIGFNAEAHATSLSWAIFNDLGGETRQLFSAAATSVMTIGSGDPFDAGSDPDLARLPGETVRWHRRAQRMPMDCGLVLTSFIVVWLMMAAFPFIWTLWGSFKVELDFFSIADWTNAISGGGPNDLWQPVHRRRLSRCLGSRGLPSECHQHFHRLFLRSADLVDHRHARRLCAVAVRIPLCVLASDCRPDFPRNAADQLVAGYMLPFFEWNVWGILPTTIIVLVAINQPFTLWMLHSFFQNIPKELDESAKVDGCTQFQAFRHVIIPVMWPGVITTGLFSFLLAYNDFAVTAMLLSEDNRTMVPQVAAFLGTTYTEGNIMFAVAAVVSATVPLFILVMFFQRQIVSGRFPCCGPAWCRCFRWQGMGKFDRGECVPPPQPGAKHPRTQ